MTDPRAPESHNRRKLGLNMYKIIDKLLTNEDYKNADIDFALCTVLSKKYIL